MKFKPPFEGTGHVEVNGQLLCYTIDPIEGKIVHFPGGGKRPLREILADKRNIVSILKHVYKKNT